MHSVKSLVYILLMVFCLPCFSNDFTAEGLPLYYWRQPHLVNFGDYLSLKLVERIVGREVSVYKKKIFTYEKKLLAVGSILYFANEGDVVWGSGTNGKVKNINSYSFTNLDVRATRGPLTHQFLMENFGIESPEIYGDPALLLPYFFPELVKAKNPKYEYIVIPHYTEEKLFPKNEAYEVVYPTEPLFTVIDKILNSRFVISSSLHGLVVAEAFGIPARYLRVTENEPLLKYCDYYLGTNRSHFQIAASIDEALAMGGEPPFQCDLKKLYEAFPFEFWPNVKFKQPDFKN